MTSSQNRNELLARLQTAADFELATIPAYLVALFSIKRPANRAVAENLRSVVVEEMLHLTLVANLMASVGGSVRLTGNRVPSYPLKMTFHGHAFTDRRFDVNLGPLSAAAIETFMAIEQPREPRFELHAFKKKDITIPERTIGEFYDTIATLLEQLSGEMGDALFVGDPAKQIGEGYYWSAGGKPITIRDMESAKRALRIVIDQGEGGAGSIDDGDSYHFGHPYEVAHYFRFKEIHHGRRYAAGDDPWQPPTGEPLSVDYGAVFPIKTNARHADYVGAREIEDLSFAFNRQYSLMLLQLEEALNGNPKVLYTAIMNGMHAISDLGLKLVALPIPGDLQQRHASPTFEWVDP
jgi:hypothetical protein